MTEAAIFLDRDGVINVDSGYVSHWDDFEFMPRAIQAMRFFLDGYVYKKVIDSMSVYMC